MTTAVLGRKAIQLEIRKLNKVPPLSAIAQRIIAAVNEPEISLKRLAEVLEESATVTARLIGLANSAYFGVESEVTTVEHAVIQVLGLDMVRSFTLGFLVADVFDVRKCPSFRSTDYWLNAMVTARLAHELGQLKHFSQDVVPHEALTAGLIANMGLLALVHVFPVAMDQLIREAESSPQTIAQILRNSADTDQFQVGAWLADKWGLPDIYRTVLANHAQAHYSGRHDTVVRIVHVSVALAKSLSLDHADAEMASASGELLGISPATIERIVRNCELDISKIRETAVGL